MFINPSVMPTSFGFIPIFACPSSIAYRDVAPIAFMNRSTARAVSKKRNDFSTVESLGNPSLNFNSPRYSVSTSSAVISD